LSTFAAAGRNTTATSILHKNTPIQKKKKQEDIQKAKFSKNSFPPINAGHQGSASRRGNKGATGPEILLMIMKFSERHKGATGPKILLLISKFPEERPFPPGLVSAARLGGPVSAAFRFHHEAREGRTHRGREKMQEIICHELPKTSVMKKRAASERFK